MIFGKCILYTIRLCLRSTIKNFLFSCFCYNRCWFTSVGCVAVAGFVVTAIVASGAMFLLDNSRKFPRSHIKRCYVQHTHTIFVLAETIVVCSSHSSLRLLYYPSAIERMVYLAKALNTNKYEKIMRSEVHEGTMKITFQDMYR